MFWMYWWLLLLLMARIARHDSSDAKVRCALTVRIAIVIEIIEEASIGWLTRAIIAFISSATRYPWGNGRGGGGGALGLHFPSEKAPRVLLVLLALGSSATATTSPASTPKRRQDQSVSLPSGKGTRLQQHHLPIPCRLPQLLPKDKVVTWSSTNPLITNPSEVAPNTLVGEGLLITNLGKVPSNVKD